MYTEVSITEETLLTNSIEDLKSELRRIEQPHMFKRVEGDETERVEVIPFQPKNFPIDGLPDGRTNEINQWLSHHIRFDRLPLDVDQGMSI